MSDPLVVTTHESWFSRLRTAFSGILTGFALILGAIVLLFWNEGRSANAIRVNDEGAAAVHAVAADRINPTKEGMLVHLTAPATAMGERRDPTLAMASDAIALVRTVEYYQWHEQSRSETKTKLGGGQETVTTYSYDEQWSESPQDSSRFQQAAQHSNPAPALAKAEFRAEQARAGAFTLETAVLNGLNADRPLELTTAHAEAASKALSRAVSLSDGALYVGANPATPAVGDMRIRYRIAPQGMTISVVGAQSGKTIQPYPTKAGGTILMVRDGTVSAEQMFDQARSGNKTLAWVLRGVGFAVLIAGFGLLFAPLGVIADVLPIAGTIVRTGTGFVAGVAGLAIGTLTIAVAWLFHRPLLSVVLAAAVAALVYGVMRWRRTRRPASPTAASA